MAEVRDALATCPHCKVTYRYVIVGAALEDPERPCHRCDPQEESDGDKQRFNLSRLLRTGKGGGGDDGT